MFLQWVSPGPEVIKLFIILNSAEHDIYPAQMLKCQQLYLSPVYSECVKPGIRTTSPSELHCRTRIWYACTSTLYLLGLC